MKVGYESWGAEGTEGNFGQNQNRFGLGKHCLTLLKGKQGYRHLC